MRDTVISLCDHSGTWSLPYREAGYNVIQVDPKLDNGDALLFPSARSDTPRLPREFADIGEYVNRVYAVLSAPVCTVFSGSGAKHRRSDDDIRQGLALVDASYRIATVTNATVFALENPVGKLQRWIGKPIMRFHPSDYAGLADDPRSEQYTKYTCLFGWFNTELTTDYSLPAVDGSKLWRQYGGKSDRTKELRSITPQGFSRAFYMANNDAQGLG